MAKIKDMCVSDDVDRMTIIVNLHQARTMIDALELYSRIIMGQFDHIRYLFVDRKIDFDKLDKTLAEIKKIVYPELSDRQYESAFSRHIHPGSSIAWDIYQCMRYEHAWYKYPEGGVTVSFAPPLNTSNHPLCYVDINGKRKLTPKTYKEMSK